MDPENSRLRIYPERKHMNNQMLHEWINGFWFYVNAIHTFQYTHTESFFLFIHGTSTIKNLQKFVFLFIHETFTINKFTKIKCSKIIRSQAVRIYYRTTEKKYLFAFFFFLNELEKNELEKLHCIIYTY